MKTIFSAGEVQHYIVNGVKSPLVKGLNLLFKGTDFDALQPLLQAYCAMKELPEPTKENTSHPNTKILIDIRDEFFRWEDNPGRFKVFKVMWNFIIIVYDYDAYYRDRIDWVLDRLVSVYHLWQGIASNKPRSIHWREFDQARADRLNQKQALMQHSIQK